MPNTKQVTATAPAKVILFGEHAAVYGLPAIAAPVNHIAAKTTISARHSKSPQTITVHGTNLQGSTRLSLLPLHDPIAAIINATINHFGIPPSSNIHITISSTIPIAAGLGSSAAVFTAIAHALGDYFGHAFHPHRVSQLVNSVENLVHADSSGIDAVVTAYAQPVYFIKGQSPERLHFPRSFCIAIADSGIQASTKVAVRLVRQRYERNPVTYSGAFKEIGQITKEARSAIIQGSPNKLAPLMTRNHELLQLLGVSTNYLDQLVAAARSGGALGAKLSGAGMGGNIIALVDENRKHNLRRSLLAAGAKTVILTQVHTPC